MGVIRSVRQRCMRLGSTMCNAQSLPHIDIVMGVVGEVRRIVGICDQICDD